MAAPNSAVLLVAAVPSVPAAAHTSVGGAGGGGAPAARGDMVEGGAPGATPGVWLARAIKVEVVLCHEREGEGGEWGQKRESGKGG